MKGMDVTEGPGVILRAEELRMSSDNKSQTWKQVGNISRKDKEIASIRSPEGSSEGAGKFTPSTQNQI